MSKRHKNIKLFSWEEGLLEIRPNQRQLLQNATILLQNARVQNTRWCSIMCGFYCISFIEYKLAEKTLLDYINLFSPNDYTKHDKIM